MKKTLGMMVLIAGGLAYAQTDSRRATMKGSRGDTGKCTIEVNVDGVAEVEILGDRAELHTLAGAPANWVRFECNDTLPRFPDDFRFSGIDGRGRQTLIRDPRENRGVAVVRLEDSKGGREGYTFDIEWRGYANSSVNGRGQRPGNGGGFGNLSRRYNTDENVNGVGLERAADVCVDAVRTKANRDYGYRNIDVGRVSIDTNPSRRDWVVGRFTYRRGLSTDEYEFGCAIDNNGRVRNIEIRRW